jgi:CheY-like chemotaxis protein
MMPSWNRSALIVDDQPFFGMVASDILQETGFDTYHASDPSAAMAMLRSHPEIGLLVTEADLSGRGDGVELTRTVSRERPDIQIVVTAGDREVSNSDVPEGARVLRKPFSSAELRSLACGTSLFEDA